ncbi:hypothetical protein FisN_8Lh250 [Fistulifera solaris]|uniref:Uncharacterized protein n=1 Tax=Fistulifera solaris TaxID=1519565 RepID=A0A1Z5JN61_FISSO|nr:hypothetical protein FisN_8Lh250 [Fistulifera solaris]|eukprot:GAX15450.1 hypothetical protein FisN_8Lh250 [Fistulifera solaris]
MNKNYFFDELSSTGSADPPLPLESPTNTAVTNEVESAPSFYQQMQNEIQHLRNKVDKQLSDMVLSSTLELKTLTDQMKIMKEMDSSTPTRQSSPLRQTVHPNSPGSLRDLASPRNRCPQSGGRKSHSNALSVTSSASSRLREDYSRDITEPTTNLSRHASRQQRRRAQFESRSTSSSTSSRLNEVVSHDITEPAANLTRYANRRHRQTETLHVQTSEPRTAVSSMSGSESSPIFKEIVISSRNRPALQSLASSPTEKGVALANDRLGQINEEENEDESLVEQSDPIEYQEIHEVTRKQHKVPKRKNKDLLAHPPNETYPPTRRGAAYDKYRTLNKETLLRPWRQKKNDKRGNTNDGEGDDNEPMSYTHNDQQQNTNYGLPLVQMVSSDEVSNPLPEETNDPARALSPIYDKTRISEQYIVPPDSSKVLNQNAHLESGPLSPSEKVYRQHENAKESGLGAHWSLFSMGIRKTDPSLVNHDEEVDHSEDESPSEPKDQPLTPPTSHATAESSSPSIIERNSPEPTMMDETTPRRSLAPSQSPVRNDASPWQSALQERVSVPMQNLLCGTGSPTFTSNQLVVSPRQTITYQLPRQTATSINYTEPGRQLDDPPDATVYDPVLPSRQDDPSPTSIERRNQSLPNAKLLRAAMATSEQCAITIYPSIGTYHDAIVLKTYNEEKKEEESAVAVRSKGERRVRLEQVETKTVQDPYGDYGVYTGLLLKGLPYGQGTMAYADGRTYVGEWKSGRWHGHGKTTFSNGDVYIGQYYMDKRHGFGRYEWIDGRIYDGEFKNDQREGKGTYSFPDSSVYSGDFHKGLRHGQGCYKFADSSVYNGGFKNGKYDGVGECIWADGRCYRGEWKDGWAHGYGVEMRADGTIRHDGEWKRDKPVRRNKDDARRSTSRGREHGNRLQKINSEVDRYTVVYVKEQESLQSSSTDSEL